MPHAAAVAAMTHDTEKAPDSIPGRTHGQWWIATWSWRRWLVLGICVLATAAMIRADTDVRRWYRVAVWEDPGLSVLAQTLTKALNPEFACLMVLAACVVAWRRWREVAKTLCAGIAVQAVIIEVLKDLLGRERPVKTGGLTIFAGPEAGSHSMPSGHAGLAFVLATMLSAFFPRGRWLFYPIAAAVALARVHVDRHFPSDVFVAALIGILTGQWALWRFSRAREPALEPAALAPAGPQAAPIGQPAAGADPQRR